MKNNIFLCCFLLIVFTEITSAQNKFKAGLIAGLSASQVHGDTYWGFHKAGIAAGAYIKSNINEKWDAKFEIMYIQKGSRKNPDPANNDYVLYFLKLDYIEVPLMLRWHYKNFVFEGGAAYAVLINDYEENQFGPVNNLVPLEKSDISTLYGFNYSINDHFSTGIRNINSMFPVRKFDIPIYYPNRIQNLFNKGMYNNVLITTIQYQF